MKVLGFTILLFTLLVAACNSPRPTAEAITPTTSPTSTEPILQSSPGAPPPFTTTTPVIVIENPFLHLTQTPEPPSIALSKETVSILRPGPGSFVISPFRVRGQAGPTWLDRVEIKLIGEDGRIITESIVYLSNIPGNLGPFFTQIEFTTPMFAEAARLEVHNFSTINGELDHIASVNLTLLSIGTPRTHFVFLGPEKLEINFPREGDTIEGGEINVRGRGWVESDTALRVEIIGGEGEILGSGLVKLNTNEIGVAGTFELSVAYQIDEPQQVRIAVYERSKNVPGIVHYTSILVLLKP